VAVGRHGQVLDTKGVEAGDIVFHSFADQRLAARDANFANTEVQENVSEAVEFWPGEDFVVVAVIFGVCGTAIDTAKVAAVGNRDAEIGDLAPEFVVKGHGSLRTARLETKKA
jgi:hypothetical protein